MKIADLAEAIGVDAANISRLETGKQKQFTEQALSNIARSLGVDIADLFTSDVKSNTVCKNSISEDVAQVKDVFRIEMLDISASAGNGLIQGGDVIDLGRDGVPGAGKHILRQARRRAAQAVSRQSQAQGETQPQGGQARGQEFACPILA